MRTLLLDCKPYNFKVYGDKPLDDHPFYADCVRKAGGNVVCVHCPSPTSEDDDDLEYAYDEFSDADSGL